MEILQSIAAKKTINSMSGYAKVENDRRYEIVPSLQTIVVKIDNKQNLLTR